MKMVMLWEAGTDLLLADWGGWGRPPSRMPRNSGHFHLCSQAVGPRVSHKVESSVDRDSVMKMMLVTEYMAVPKYLDTAVGFPANMFL